MFVPMVGCILIGSRRVLSIAKSYLGDAATAGPARIYKKESGHMKEEVVYCGIDVAKKQLDLALGQERWQTPNTKGGHCKSVKTNQSSPAQSARDLRSQRWL